MSISTYAALASPYQHRPAGRIKIGLRQSECLTDPQTGAPEHHDDRA